MKNPAAVERQVVLFSKAGKNFRDARAGLAGGDDPSVLSDGEEGA